jgi:LAO/AO transport system kinase
VGRPPDVEDLVARARRGEHRAVAKLISLVETDTAACNMLLREVAARLAPYTGRAHVVGLTGPPGGQSTSTSALVAALRGQRTVGVLAVDPTSPFSGGAVLGDRLRMQSHASDEGVFIRSMATRGHLGGLARATSDATLVLDAAGKDLVIIETVGVGQDEVDIVRSADVTIVMLVPGAGDDVQALKAGIMEIADIFVVNKADREGSGGPCGTLELAIAMSDDGGADRAAGRDPSCRPSPCGARGSTISWPPSTRTARGWTRRARGWSVAGRGPLRRSRRSRWSRCGRGSVTSAARGAARARRPRRRWRPRSLPGRRRAAGLGAPVEGP